MQAEVSLSLVSGAKVPSLIVMTETRTQERSTHQEPGGGAGLSELDGLSCCCSSTVAFWILSRYDFFSTQPVVSVETTSEVQKLLRTGGIPTSLTWLFWRWLMVTGRTDITVC